MKTSVQEKVNRSTVTNSESGPTVSIGMPVYNGAKFIEQTLDSITSQTFRDYEVVISDNASTDGTEEICRRFSERYANIQYYRNDKNLGASHNYNAVFERSSGRFFKWAAADDLLHEQFLEKCLYALDAHSDAVLSYTETTVIGEQGEVLSHYDDPMDVTDDDESQRFVGLLHSVRECNAVFGLIRTDVLRKTPLIGNYIRSDVYLLAELSLYGKFVRLPDRLFFRREHPAASSYDHTIASQVAFFDPAKTDSGIASSWNSVFATFAAVNRSPIKVSNKAKLYVFCLRRINWLRSSLWGELIAACRHLLGRLKRRTGIWTR